MPGLSQFIRRTHHTALCVRDFEAARDFYIQVLGFQLEGEMDHRGEPGLGTVLGLPGAVIRWAMLARDDHRMELFKFHEPAGREEIGRQCDLGYMHMAFEVDDVDAAYEAVQALGLPTTSPPQILRGGRTKVLYILAPEGNVTELLEFRQPESAP